MLRNNVFALASVLALGVGAAACGDTEEPGPVGCEATNTCPPPPPENVNEPGSGRQAYSYLSGLSIPGAECCADLNGDGEVDNALGTVLPTLLGLIGDDLDLPALIQGILEDGTLTLLFHHDSPPEDLTGARTGYELSIAMGDSESDWAARAAGDGVFTMDEPLVVVPNTTNMIGRGMLTARLAKLPLSLDISGFIDEDSDINLPSPLGLEFSAIQLELSVTEPKENGIATADITENNGKPTNYLTGALAYGDVAALVNIIFDCGVGKDLVSFEETSTEIQLACDDAVATEIEESGAEGLCESVGLVCGLVPSVVDILEADVDTNGNGVADGISLALRLKLAGASLAE